MEELDFALDFLCKNKNPYGNGYTPQEVFAGFNKELTILQMQECLYEIAREGNCNVIQGYNKEENRFLRHECLFFMSYKGLMFRETNGYSGLAERINSEKALNERRRRAIVFRERLMIFWTALAAIAATFLFLKGVGMNPLGYCHCP